MKKEAAGSMRATGPLVSVPSPMLTAATQYQSQRLFSFFKPTYRAVNETVSKSVSSISVMQSVANSQKRCEVARIMVESRLVCQPHNLLMPKANKIRQPIDATRDGILAAKPVVPKALKQGIIAQ